MLRQLSSVNILPELQREWAATTTKWTIFPNNAPRLETPKKSSYHKFTRAVQKPVTHAIRAFNTVVL
jgi:hypothetical protein